MGKNSIRYPSKLGDAIKKARKEKGWTLAKVAQKLNTNGTLIGEYERGLKLPNVYMAFDLAQVLGFDLSEVLRDGKTERQRAFEDAAKLLEELMVYGIYEIYIDTEIAWEIIGIVRAGGKHDEE